MLIVYLTIPHPTHALPVLNPINSPEFILYDIPLRLIGNSLYLESSRGGDLSDRVYSVPSGLQENDQVTEQPHLQIGQKYIHARHVADPTVGALLPAV